MLGAQTLRNVVQQFWNIDLIAPAESLPAELEDSTEYIEVGDFVKVIPTYATSLIGGAWFGYIEEVNVETQWAKVYCWGVDGIFPHREWFSVDELMLLVKQAALEAEAANAAH